MVYSNGGNASRPSIDFHALYHSPSAPNHTLHDPTQQYIKTDFQKLNVRDFLTADTLLVPGWVNTGQWTTPFLRLSQRGGPDSALSQDSNHALNDKVKLQELLRLRRQFPALRGQGFRVVHDHNQNRVLAFQRWVEGEGHDVLVAVHLSPNTRSGYRIGFPGGGTWREIFNSDVYDNQVNPNAAGNGGAVFAKPQPLHGLGHSAALVLPSNSVLVFAR